MTPELTAEQAVIMAAECPVIRAAYATGDTSVITRAEAYHPASRCEYVKAAEAAKAAEAEAARVAAEAAAKAARAKQAAA